MKNIVSFKKTFATILLLLPLLSFSQAGFGRVCRTYTVGISAIITIETEVEVCLWCRPGKCVVTVD